MTGVAKPRLSIVHWMPVEMYPPTMNLARHFDKLGWDVSLHTTEPRHQLKPFPGDRIRVTRARNPSNRGAFARALEYLRFYLGTTLRLVKEKPDAILYYEPQSSLPVFLASLARKDVPVFIHHHEYHGPEDFEKPGMRLPRLFHRIERRRLFPRSKWISHTNDQRLRLFASDNPTVPREKLKVLPNFPPSIWFGSRNVAWSESQPPPLRIAYVGSLSRSDTYIEKFTAWVQQHAGLVTLDIFAYNLDRDTLSYLRSIREDAIRFHEAGIPYDDLPGILRHFHVGAILYRATTLNYIHNASNKLFEYLACGMDVIFPVEMLGVQPFVSDSAPRVIPVDFSSLQLDVGALSERTEPIPGRKFDTAEDAMTELQVAIYNAIGITG